MPFGYPLPLPLGGPLPQGVSSDQVFDLLVQLLPTGASKLYGLAQKTGDVYNLFAGIGDTLKTFCIDYIALLRAEISPLTAAIKIPDYENALGLTTTPTALTGTTTQRRAQIISKYREQGAFTVANIQGILAPLLGYTNAAQLAIIEANRAALTAAHTYTNSTGASIGASSSATQTVQVLDDGGVSDAGLQLVVKITCTNPEQLSFALTGPTGASGQASVTWAAGSLPVGAASSTSYQLNDLTSAGKSIFAGIPPKSWTLQVNTGSAACTLVTWSLFVEGGGARDGAGNSGLGEQMHDWIVQYSSAIGSAPNLGAARSSVQRIEPADSNGTIVQNSTAVPSSALYPPFLVMNA